MWCNITACGSHNTAANTGRYNPRRVIYMRRHTRAHTQRRHTVTVNARNDEKIVDALNCCNFVNRGIAKGNLCLVSLVSKGKASYFDCFKLVSQGSNDLFDIRVQEYLFSKIVEFEVRSKIVLTTRYNSVVPKLEILENLL